MNHNGRLYTVSELYRDAEYEAIYCEGVTAYWKRAGGKWVHVEDSATIAEIERRMEAARPMTASREYQNLATAIQRAVDELDGDGSQAVASQLHAAWREYSEGEAEHSCQPPSYWPFGSLTAPSLRPDWTCGICERVWHWQPLLFDGGWWCEIRGPTLQQKGEG